MVCAVETSEDVSAAARATWVSAGLDWTLVAAIAADGVVETVDPKSDDDAESAVLSSPTVEADCSKVEGSAEAGGSTDERGEERGEEEEATYPLPLWSLPPQLRPPPAPPSALAPRS